MHSAASAANCSRYMQLADTQFEHRYNFVCLATLSIPWLRCCHLYRWQCCQFHGNWDYKQRSNSSFWPLVACPACCLVIQSHSVLPLCWLQVENHLAHTPLRTRKVARALAVFLLSYATAYMETLTIAHVSQSIRAVAVFIGLKAKIAEVRVDFASHTEGLLCSTAKHLCMLKAV